MKRILPIFLILALLLGAAPALAADGLAFSDVQRGAWYYDAVSYTAGLGLFNGTSPSTFSPQSTMTRAMFVTVLGRNAGVAGEADGVGVVTASGVNMRSGPGTDTDVLCVLNRNTRLTVLGLDGEWYHVRYSSYVGYIRGDLMEATSSVFSDVPYGCWYSSHVNWAYRQGIAEATGSGTFSPDRDITREEICSMLYRYSALSGTEPAVTLGKTVFIDDSDISSSCSNAVYAMKNAGVVNGYEDGSFRPADCATRAEVSTMLMRFFQNYDPPAVETEEPFDFNSVPVSSVSSSLAVGDSYFDDACFIGHSLVVGMQSFFHLHNTSYYAVNGISASKMLTYDDFELASTHEDDDGEEVHDTGTLEDALEEKSFGKVYIMLGTNELSSASGDVAAYYGAMTQLVSMVQRLQPGAAIYLISITPVTRECSASEGSRFTRDNAVLFNNRLRQVATEQDVQYLDVFTLLCDSQGYLPDDNATADGIHILSAQYGTVKSYLKTHTA